MANGVLVIGSAGSGKSTAIRNLDPKKTFIIAPDKKPLPIKGWRNQYKTVMGASNKIDMDKSNYLEIDDPNQIIRVLEYISKSRTDIEVVVLDTLSHVLTAEFMKSAKTKGFEKYTDLALNIYNICNAIRDARSDLTIFVTGHTEIDDQGEAGKVLKLRTIGKLLNEKITTESLFTTVLITSVDLKNEVMPYGFVTQNDGSTVAKSPMGMFKDFRIPNDYKYIVDSIKQYEN